MSQANVKADEIGVGYRGDFVKVEIALCAVKRLGANRWSLHPTSIGEQMNKSYIYHKRELRSMVEFIFALGAMTQLVRFEPRRVYCWLKTISKPPLRPGFTPGL
ncbi:hypothetical protein V6N13_132842 [Hibiscus sabdariffa]